MENCKNGYENTACNPNDEFGGVQISSIEMDRVTDDGMNTVVVTGCCGSGLNGNTNHLSGDKSPENGSPDVCQPKCPAVRSSPWDPLKTRIIAILTIAMVAWLMIGVFVKNL
ncbi:uncharacterized protein LOC113558467 [Rhopalosiphum maidis]|uniref:uncharacterized protein LOC113558467 n=1 Tax=Rhopalosiphum maidis TaxID=43146 RepID=UPI000EFE2127|nr:uncharacterized protein LOC113558467 [Rhopalosiphum maidis]